MANLFSHIKTALAPVDTIPFTLPGVRVNSDKEVVLHLAQAGEANVPFFNALLARMKQPERVAQAKRGAAGVSRDTMIRNRREDIELFSLHVVRGWDNVMDGDRPVPISAELVQQLLEQLPDDLVDEIRDAAKEPGNFRLGGAEQLAGN